jgi:hypothetical protein
MNKFLAFITTVLLACMLGGIYGIIHDQLTYTISPEYYTKFKFEQFLQLTYKENEFVAPREAVAVVGIMATWWVGLIIGVVLGLVGFIHADWKKRLAITMKAFMMTITVAFFTGLLGLAYGYFVLANQPITDFSNWYLPEGLVDVEHFIMVGSMHNFSYVGGLLGLIVGVIYSVRQKQKI